MQITQQFYIRMKERLTFHEEDIRGWAKEGEENRDSSQLANILRRKTTIGTLPQINERITNFSNIRQKISQVKFVDKKIDNSPTHKALLKSTRLKTQGFAIPYNDNKYVKKEILSCAITEQAPSPTLPKSQAKKDVAKVQKQQNNYHINKSESCEFKRSNNLEIKLFDNDKHKFFKEDVQKINSIKNQDKIKRNQSQTLKNTFSKLYVKLNTLQMVNDVRKQLTDHSTSKQLSPTSKQYHIDSDKNFQKLDRFKQFGKKSKLAKQTMNKINLKFKQTFLKQDIFSKQRQKLQKLEKGFTEKEFNDQIIFSNNSLLLPKKQQTNLQTTFKIQIIKHPQTHLLKLK